MLMAPRVLLLLVVLSASSVVLGRDDPELPWKHEIAVPGDPFVSWTSPPYIKFTIITKEGFDPVSYTHLTLPTSDLV